MRRLLGLVFAALAATLLLALNAGQAFADVVHCGDTITQDTKLDSNLLSCPGDGLVVGAANVTIDLNGHRIWGSGTGNGITNVRQPPQVNCSHDSCSSISGFPGLTVKNGTIGGFATDIYAVGDHQTFQRLTIRGTLAGCCFGQYDRLFPSDTRVLNSRVDGTISVGNNSLVQGNRTGGGVSIRGGTISRNVIGGGVAQGQTYRTHLGAGPVVVTRNVIGHGLFLPASDSAQVDHNTISGGINAMHLDEGTSNLSISSNRVYASGQDGIRITGNWCATVTGNRVYGNAANGIHVTGGCSYDGGPCTGITGITHNVVYQNALDGIYVAGLKCAGSVEHNSIWGNGADGLYVGSNHALIVIAGNSARRNGGDGIHVGPAAGAPDVLINPFVTLSGNSANENKGLGIHAVPGVVDGGGNRVWRNGSR